MSESVRRTCDGETFLGFTVKKCDQEATIHAYQDRYEQYDVCARHHYFYLHGRYPDAEPVADEGDEGDNAIRSVTYTNGE